MTLLQKTVSRFQFLWERDDHFTKLCKPREATQRWSSGHVLNGTGEGGWGGQVLGKDGHSAMNNV